MMAQLVSIREASEEAKVSIGYINQLIKNGTLMGQKIGKQWAIDRASFDEWQAQRKARQSLTPAEQAETEV